MTLIEYSLLAFSSLFVVVDPIAAVPAFIAMTSRDSPQTKLRMARLACLVGAGVMVVFTLAGKGIFKVLGITLPAFQIAGSLLLLRIAMDMLYARRSAAQETDEEVEAGAAKEDIAITPLAVPMLAGPGAISTALILLNQAESFDQRLALLACITVVFLSSYLIFHLSIRGARKLSPLALKLMTRLMGLLLAAVSVQFAINGLAQTPLFDK
jgi:multiple antibiotic resistance protein